MCGEKLVEFGEHFLCFGVVGLGRGPICDAVKPCRQPREFAKSREYENWNQLDTDLTNMGGSISPGTATSPYALNSVARAHPIL